MKLSSKILFSYSKNNQPEHRIQNTKRSVGRFLE